MHFHMGRDIYELSTIFDEKKERTFYKARVKRTSLQRCFFGRRFLER